MGVVLCSHGVKLSWLRGRSRSLRPLPGADGMNWSLRFPGLDTNFLVYWSIVQFIQNFNGQNASCTGQVQEQLN